MFQARIRSLTLLRAHHDARAEARHEVVGSTKVLRLVLRPLDGDLHDGRWLPGLLERLRGNDLAVLEPRELGVGEAAAAAARQVEDRADLDPFGRVVAVDGRFPGRWSG